MSLTKITPIRLIAIVLCLVALGTYFIFVPTPSHADEADCNCYYNNGKYSDQACRGKQRCSCNSDCSSCIWVDDPNYSTESLPEDGPNN
jgi:hypothetical protein